MFAHFICIVFHLSTYIGLLIWLIGFQSPVLEDNLEAHVKKCPLLKQAQTLSLQPYYQKGINRVRDESAQNGERKEQQEEDFSSEMKRKLVYNLTASQLTDLLCKIRAVHSSICKEIGISYKVPEACNVWIQRQVDGYVALILVI